MPRRKKKGTESRTNKKATAANLGYKAELWKMADALRGSIDAADCKHVVLGLIFLSQFASAEGKKGGEFYTPRWVKLLVKMLEPYRDRVYDCSCSFSGRT